MVSRENSVTSREDSPQPRMSKRTNRCWAANRSYHRRIGASRHSISQWVGGIPASMTASPPPIDQ